ncbi:uncharacterized protein J7T54_002659 [Emericellopsis cladophorae]|uniref:Ubiquitin-like 1-activating enzyme E1A n=1 Tax=Emericellopsis cladophorae TaxID=2686198 RepID=A0A9P9XWV4_9HYPO|nr:uncharacterized protein J7T54_002659 [Emericellopsis cladophorae]KAI6778829.1 hypothetical protein J7T54_002659 [Emericellopsis cladophorae]
MDGNGINHQQSMAIPEMGNQFLNQVPTNGMSNGQHFMPDPSASAMPMPGAELMMPLMLANGQAQVPPSSLSADEVALYDRQIRLWGVAAQAKIQSANILLITIKALATEIAKNLVLAGVGSLTILDDAPVSESDLGAQFFLAEAAGDDPSSILGQNRAQVATPAIQKMNPRVRVQADPAGVKVKGPSYFAQFDVVIATDLDLDTMNLINTATRLNGRAFYAASTHGMYGFIFSDLIEHQFVIERDLGNVPTECPKQETRTRSVVDVQTKKEGTRTIECVTKRELYSTWFLASDLATLSDDYIKSKRRLRGVSPTLSCLRALWEFMQINGGRIPGNRDDLKLFTQIATQKHKALSLPSETLTPEFLRSFLQNLGSEIAPVTAILGGQLAQDVINVLGQKEQPIQNMVIFDGTTMEALVYPLHPEGVIGAALLSLGGGDDAMAPNGAGMMMPPGGDMSAMGMGYDPSMGGMGMMNNGIGGMAPPPTQQQMNELHLQHGQQQQQQPPQQQQQEANARPQTQMESKPDESNVAASGSGAPATTGPDSAADKAAGDAASRGS